MIPRVPGEPVRDLGRPIEEVRARVAPELDGMRLDRALQRLMPWRSRSSIQRLIRDGHVALKPDAREDPSRRADPARASVTVRCDDILVMRVPPRLLPEHPPEPDLPLRELFEDPWLVAVDKPAGLAVHPSGRRLTGTLINLLHRRYRNSDPELDVVPRLCHRLDRETSGVLLIAKQGTAHAAVRRQFEEHRVGKSYLALVEGRPARDEGLIDIAIGPALDSAIRLKMAPRADGLEARTRYRIRECGADVTLLECFPETGRQHQLRVHFAAIGHPIVGDKLYGPDESWFLDSIAGCLSAEARTRLRLPRHALHSHSLRLAHPATGNCMELVAPLPSDMASVLG